MISHRIAFPLAAALSVGVLLGAAADAEAARYGNNRIRVSAKDRVRLDRLATDYDGKIRRTATPVVDLHITEASLDSGVRFKKVSNPWNGDAGPTVFEVTGVDQAGGNVKFVLTGSASGHVMKPKYGGRPFSVVEEYGNTDTIHLTHVKPGATASTPVLATKSRGLVTQEAFEVDLSQKGKHTLYYYRVGADGYGSGQEGTEPELRQVDIIVK